MAGGWTSRGVVCAGLAAALLSAGAAGAADCALHRLEGERIDIRGPAGWVALPGAALPPGAAALRTGPGTRVEIRCAGGVVVTLGEGTEIDLSELAAPADADGVLVRLFRGIAGFVAPEPQAAPIAVATPLAIASIRSTEWHVESARRTGTAVFVRKGRVAVTAGAATVELAPGEGVDVATDGTLPAPHPWGAARIARAGGRLGFGWP